MPILNNGFFHELWVILELLAELGTLETQLETSVVEGSTVCCAKRLKDSP